IGETLEVNGLMHFAKDVEDTIEQAHENIAPGGSVVFQRQIKQLCLWFRYYMLQARH
ncbi:hypothetical protein CPB97_003473, partial [Podila verticillata]